MTFSQNVVNFGVRVETGARVSAPAPSTGVEVLGWRGVRDLATRHPSYKLSPAS